MAWLTDYTYRKSVTLSRESGAVSDYQLKLLLGESSGATGEDVDAEGNCLDTFDDIRFTTSDGETLLPYWIESISGSTPNQLATIWIKFDSVGTGATTFYMYYGNAGASAYSSGTDTFIQFDDFERGNDGDTIGGDWTENTVHVEIKIDQKYTGTRSAKFLGVNPEAVRVVAGSSEISIRFHTYKEDTSDLTFIHNDGSSRCQCKWLATEALEYLSAESGYLSLGESPAHSTWHLFEMNNFDWSANTYDFWLNGVKIGTSLTEYIDSFGEGFWMRGSNNTGATWIDNYIVRNWRSTEPAWGAWGAEEIESTDPPDPIDDLSATPSGQSIDLSWSEPEDNGSAILGYTIEYSTTVDDDFGISFGCTTTSTTVSSLGYDTEYEFRAFSYNANGTSLTSNVATATTDSEIFTYNTACAFVSQSFTEISSLTHLEGQVVSILANGNVLDEQTVVDGTITLDDYYSIINVGLPYYSDLETLKLNVPSKGFSTIQGSRIKVGNVTFHLQETKGGYIGPDEDNLYNAFSDSAFNQYSGQNIGEYDLFTGKVRQPLGAEYGYGGHIFYRQVAPLPVTIGSVMPEVDIGGHAR